MTDIDALELELRRLPGVTFVSLAQIPGALFQIELVTSNLVDGPALRERATAAARAHLDEPFTVELVGIERPPRVRLLGVSRTDAAEVEVHLAFQGNDAVGSAPSLDPAGVSRATLDALVRLGAELPFRFETAATFEHDRGAGVLVVLADADACRYGAASGDLDAATARATLAALNRHLAAQPRWT